MSSKDPASIDLSTVGSLLDETESGSKEVFRSQQSLGLITQRFMSLRAKNETMNLNDVAKELSIPKRRVYDVVNVLEGLGYVQKVEKNNIKWIGDDVKDEEQNQLEARVEILRQEEKILEMMIQDAQAVINLHFEDPIARPYNYVRKEDIRNTSELDTKSIIMKSEHDDSKFNVLIRDPTGSSAHEMIVKNINGVRSHALLFSNEPTITVKQESPEKDDPLPEEMNNEWSLSDVGSNQNLEQIKTEDPDEIDTEDLETFVLPSTSTNPQNTQYLPETPGRGLFFSPFKSLIDPCILPAFSDDLTSGYINITTPSRAAAEHALQADVEPPSIMDFFND
ncbi:hypothetical protein GCK72_005789 [Caenorhabditis remanei]|uniref:E2F/DP family winged-helix DNA-binding domain-containing protein n=1 Tax=Caenorhabditis remanei TaxID=31234 RepID=A0A6A5HGI7_CAERE|nr:hypothetical protein GCK72_005789 [Caenorhabditis remanei]KAF1765836.1 hypothetical protein GCK72_005789 [Caenorhabditis remanei]